MKKYIQKALSLVMVVGAFTANAQVKVGNNPTTINANAALEIESTNKGLLLPRVPLTSTTSFAPLSAHVTGMAVYNTATIGDVTPGYYYNDGTKWFRIGGNTSSFINGTTNPVAATGNNGDFYLNTTSNTLFGPKVSGTWPATGVSLVGPTGATGAAGATGATGPTGLTGATGAAGATILSGTVNPVAANGVNGDFYLNTTSNTLFGPKASGAWPPTGTSLVGPTGATGAAGATGATGAVGATGPTGLTGATGAAGATILNGTVNPVAANGVNGDFYLNTTSNTLFGPKASGAWPPTGTSLVGPAGATGATGAAGPTGATGPAGATGATGPAGSNATVTSNNGITTTAGNIQLGGALVQPTTISGLTATNKLAITGTGADMFNVGSNAISVNGTTGNVGIGTVASSSEKLRVGGNRIALIPPTPGEARYYLYNAGAQAEWLFGQKSGSNNNFTFTKFQSGVESDYLSISNTNGYVGIGTVAPTEVLDVVGNVKFSGALMPNNLAGTAGQVLTSAGAGVAPTWANNTAVSSNIYTADGTLAGNRTVTQGANSLNFAGTGVTTFNSGNVGIGTTAPLAKLDVTGDAVFGIQKAPSDGALSIGANIVNISTPTKMADTLTKAPETALRLYRAGTSTVKFNASADFQVGTYRNGIASQTNLRVLLANGSTNQPDREVMTWQGNGNVGINTTFPQAQLHLKASQSDSTVVQEIRMASAPNNAAAKVGFKQRLGFYGRDEYTATERLSAGIEVLFGGNVHTPTFPGVSSTAMIFSVTDRLNNIFERMRIVENGNVGIGTTTPTSTLQVAGSFATAIRTVSSAATAEGNDHTILCNTTTAGFTLTLPAANSATGRIYVIRKTDETNNVLTFSSAIKLSETTTFNSLNYLGTIRIQSDGTSWVRID